MSSRLLICPIEISGQYRNLALALKDKFSLCEYYTFYTHPFDYGPDIGTSVIPTLLRRIHDIGRKHRYLRPLCIPTFDLFRFFFLVTVIFRFDIFFFGFGLSILRWNLDLPILRILGKRVVLNLSHGSDMTPPYLDGAFLNRDLKMPPARHLYRLTRRKILSIRFLEYFASDIIGSPLSSSYLANRPFINVFHLGRLTQAHFNSSYISSNRVSANLSNRPFRIVHFPSHAPGKGSYAIHKIVNKLIDDGFKIDFLELRDIPNECVLKNLATADLLIDQLYSDLHLSALSAEALVLGVPAIICGYEIKDLPALFPEIPFPPVITAHPSKLYSTLQLYLSTPNLLSTISKHCSTFMNNVWSITNVADNFASTINGDFPRSWYFDPKNSPFIFGYGLESLFLKHHLRDYISSLGISALCLDHNKIKRKLILDGHHLV